jgi:phosphopantetheinyl transferase
MSPPDEMISWIGGMGAAVDATQGVAYLADLDDPAEKVAMQLPPTAEDRRRAMAYGEAAREHFLSRRAVLRQLFATRLGCHAASVEIGVDGFGAPRLVAPDTRSPQFLSISARGAFAAFAIAQRPVGIDIEILGKAEPIPSAALHPKEAVRLTALNEAERHKAFLEIWTTKEAYFKALRLGLRREPSEVEIRLDAHAGVCIIDRGVLAAARVSFRKMLRRTSTTIIATCVVLG